MRIESSNAYQPIVGKPSEKTGDKEILPQAEELSPVQKKPTKEEALQKKIEEGQTLIAYLQQQLQVSNEQNKREDEAAEKQLKCNKIAELILSGDRVAPADMQYLMKNDPGMFSRAIMLRMTKENPKESRKITDEDDLRVIPEFGAKASAGQTYSAEGDASAQSDLGTILDTKT